MEGATVPAGRYSPMPVPSATAVYVAYAIDRLDVGWLPDDTPVVVVHNDDRLPEDAVGGAVTHVRPGGNVGFGAGVNAALPYVATDRVVLLNPDTELRDVHWRALTDAGP